MLRPKPRASAEMIREYSVRVSFLVHIRHVISRAHTILESCLGGFVDFRSARADIPRKCGDIEQSTHSTRTRFLWFVTHVLPRSRKQHSSDYGVKTGPSRTLTPQGMEEEAIGVNPLGGAVLRFRSIAVDR